MKIQGVHCDQIVADWVVNWQTIFHVMRLLECPRQRAKVVNGQYDSGESDFLSDDWIPDIADAVLDDSWLVVPVILHDGCVERNDAQPTDNDYGEGDHLCGLCIQEE